MSNEAERGAPRPDNPEPQSVRNGSTEPNRTSDNPEPDNLVAELFDGPAWENVRSLAVEVERLKRAEAVALAWIKQLQGERDAEAALAAEAKAEIHANARTFAALIAEQRAKAAEVVDAAENLLHSLGARLAYEVSQDRLVEQAADTLTERVTAWRRTKNESEQH